MKFLIINEISTPFYHEKASNIQEKTILLTNTNTKLRQTKTGVPFLFLNNDEPREKTRGHLIILSSDE